MTLYCANESCIYYKMQRTDGRVEDGSCVKPHVQISESGQCEEAKSKHDGYALCSRCEGEGRIKLPGVSRSERCFECDGLGYTSEVKP